MGREGAFCEKAENISRENIGICIQNEVSETLGAARRTANASLKSLADPAPFPAKSRRKSRARRTVGRAQSVQFAVHETYK